MNFFIFPKKKFDWGYDILFDINWVIVLDIEKKKNI